MPRWGGLRASAFVASLGSRRVAGRAGGGRGTGALRVTVALGIAAAALSAVGRAWIPPAPLFMARAAIMWDLPDLDNIQAPPTTISADEVKQRGLVAYNAIHAPAGLAPSGPCV